MKIDSCFKALSLWVRRWSDITLVPRRDSNRGHGGGMRDKIPIRQPNHRAFTFNQPFNTSCSKTGHTMYWRAFYYKTLVQWSLKGDGWPRHKIMYFFRCQILKTCQTDEDFTIHNSTPYEWCLWCVWHKTKTKVFVTQSKYHHRKYIFFYRTIEISSLKNILAQ